MTRRIAPWLAVSLTFAVLNGLAAAETIRVPADCATIQEAIDKAEAGDRVLVSAGTYRGHVKLKEGVYLRSEGDDSPGKQEYAGRKPLARAERTIIDAGGSTKGAVVAGAEGATIDGFTITGLGHVNHHLPNHAHAVECRNCSATIIHNIIRDNGSTGIGQHAKKGATLGLVAAPYVADNFVFRNKGIGIGNNHRSQTVITRNVVFENCEAGIGARNEAAPLIEDNLVFRNGYGYSKLDPAECKKFDKNPNSMWPGIGIKDGARAIVRKNRSYENAVVGISVDNGAFALIEGNEVFGNRYPGIGVGGHKAAQAVIRDNVVRGNRGPGIGINIGSTATVLGNTVEKNGAEMPGIAVVAGSTAVVIGNTVKPGCMAGIAVLGATATVSGNTIEGSQMAGIRVDDSVATIDSNKVLKAGTVGIYLHDARATLTRNDVRESTHHGIAVTGTACRANVTANVLDGNGKDGGAHIYLDKDGAMRRASNEFRNAGRLGNVYQGKSKYGMPSAAEPAIKIGRFRPDDAALLGPGHTENFFKTGKEDHAHGPDDQAHEH
jgi:hypothetical protein